MVSASRNFSGRRYGGRPYVTILASEDRSKDLRPPRRSVRRQLKQEPRPAEKPEKKSPIHKKKEPER